MRKRRREADEPEVWAVEALLRGHSYGIGIFWDHDEAEAEAKSLERGGYEAHVWRL